MKSTAPAPLLTRSAVMRTLLEWPHTESPRHQPGGCPDVGARTGLLNGRQHERDTVERVAAAVARARERRREDLRDGAQMYAQRRPAPGMGEIPFRNGNPRANPARRLFRVATRSGRSIRRARDHSRDGHTTGERDGKSAWRRWSGLGRDP